MEDNNRMKKLILVLVLAFGRTGCGNNGNDNGKTEENTTKVEQQNDSVSKDDTNKVAETKGYVFEYNGVEVGMDMEAASVIDALGEPVTYFEAPSCAFEGLDKTYNYGSFEIDTYEQDGKDYISGVFLCDDLIETPEGVALYETKADMIAVYGENYKEEFGMLVYEKDGMKLNFILNGDEITSIEYTSGALSVQ